MWQAPGGHVAIDGRADTFPKLLIRNASALGARPAIRHKRLGIWQTWTWAQVLEEVRAFSIGLDESAAIGRDSTGRSVPARH
jgi:long-subunit acyl-CoA synthetase (AMP-forming)